MDGSNSKAETPEKEGTELTMLAELKEERWITIKKQTNKGLVLNGFSKVAI